MPRGRPSKFKPEMIEHARRLCLLGATNEDMARFFDVGLATFERWMKDKKEFRGAIKEGREEADANVGTRLYERAMGYSHDSEEIKVIDGEIVRVPIVKHYPPETTAAIFWLKNRRPDLWRDRKEHEANMSGGLSIRWLTDDEEDEGA